MNAAAGERKNTMKYNNKFFRTREEAKMFQKDHGGVIYSDTPRSRTKREFHTEMGIAWDARREIVKAAKTPWCVAWNERE